MNKIDVCYLGFRDTNLLPASLRKKVITLRNMGHRRCEGTLRTKSCMEAGV
jgi:hypothetical protein